LYDRIQTIIPCKIQNKEHSQIDFKVSKHFPDQFLLEYDHFFRLLSYYLPREDLRFNNNFVMWLRNTPFLADQYATELEYTLPLPREAHY
jgi:hypothetical protein